jgi:hypothetical protein
MKYWARPSVRDDASRPTERLLVGRAQQNAL